MGKHVTDYEVFASLVSFCFLKGLETSKAPMLSIIISE